MSTRSAEISGTTTTDPETLVRSLNSLLTALSLEQIHLETPQDLTPSLLLAMLESMLRARLPIPPSTRAAAGVGAMKVFLGVLEADVMQQDVGLADVDPRRLADGEWAECVFVGELLVWLARNMGYLPVELPEHQRGQDLEQRRQLDSDGDYWEGQQRAESSSMASLRADTTVMKTKRHAHKDSVTSMRTADSNPFVVRPSRPRRRSPQRDASTSYAARGRDASASYATRDASTDYAAHAPRESPTHYASTNYTSTSSSPRSPPSPIPSSHPSRTPSPTTDTLGLGLSFHPPRASSPARFDEDGESEQGERKRDVGEDERHHHGLDEEGDDDTQLCTCDHDADLDTDADPDATFCTCDGHTAHLPPPPPRRGSTPTTAAYASQGRASLPGDRRPASAADRRTPPATGSRRPSLAHDPSAPLQTTTTTTPVRYDGWIERVEGDVEAFEAARARAAGAGRSYDRGAGRSHSGAALGARTPRSPHGAGMAMGTPPAAAGVGLGTPRTGMGTARARNPTRHVSPAQHTLALMNERARLLGELAKIRTLG